jgi:hypothetical protein
MVQPNCKKNLHSVTHSISFDFVYFFKAVEIIFQLIPSETREIILNDDCIFDSVMAKDLPLQLSRDPYTKALMLFA